MVPLGSKMALQRMALGSKIKYAKKFSFSKTIWGPGFELKKYIENIKKSSSSESLGSDA